MLRHLWLHTYCCSKSPNWLELLQALRFCVHLCPMHLRVNTVTQQRDAPWNTTLFLQTHMLWAHTQQQTQTYRHTCRDTETHAQMHTDTHTQTQTHTCRSFNYFTALESVKHTPSKVACCKTGSRCREQPAYSGLPPLPVSVPWGPDHMGDLTVCTRPLGDRSAGSPGGHLEHVAALVPLPRLSLGFHLIKGSKQGTWRTWL